MRLIPIRTPFIYQTLFKSFVWKIPSSENEKVLYLTFDDGPTPEITNWTLDTLKQYNAKATFFCIGNNVEKHPSIFKRIIAEGHSVGNHTHNHIKGWHNKTSDYILNTEKASVAFKKEIPDSSVVDFFRPPYGQITPKQGRELQQLGYKIIMWSVLSFDWDEKTSTEKCYENVVKNTKSGDIIVFHDSVKASKNLQYTLPRVLAFYQEKGFTFKRIPELNQ